MGAATAISPSSPLTPGYCLDRYELLCPLADGGMASVWLARLVGKHGFEKQVAIKTILPQFASDERFRAMFLDEARIASRIAHTNVVQILDLGEQHEILYLVMEYVDSDSLSRLFRALAREDVALPQNVLLRVVADACAGLHAAHEHSVVHRDVSPQNILISTLGVSKLIDFGIAKVLSRIGDDTNAGLLKGKLSYMAPEQAVGGEMDRRTDIFAMGAVLYHMLAGAPPFAGENQLATLHKLTSAEPPPPLPANVPPAVAAVVNKALARAPDARYASAADLQAAIEAAMVESHLPCSVADVARFVKRHMAERTRTRNAMIDLALSAAAERQRVHEKLRAPMADGSVQMTAWSGVSPSIPPPDDGTLPSSSGVVPSPLETKRQARRSLAVASVYVLLAGAVAIAAWLMFAHRTQPPVAAPVHTGVTATATAVPPTETASPPSNIVSVDIDDLPKATQPRTAQPVASVPPKPVAAPSSAASGAAHHRENYGF